MKTQEKRGKTARTGQSRKKTVSPSKRKYTGTQSKRVSAHARPSASAGARVRKRTPADTRARGTKKTTAKKTAAKPRKKAPSKPRKQTAPAAVQRIPAPDMPYARPDMPVLDDGIPRAIRFIEYLADGFRHYEAARASDMEWPEFRKLICKDKELMALYEEARKLRELAVRAEADDRIEQRAFEGWDEPVYQGGHMVGVKRVFSEKCMEMLAKSVAPEKYSERLLVKNHVSGPDGGPLKLAMMPPEPKTWEEWQKVASEMLASKAANKDAES